MRGYSLKTRSGAKVERARFGELGAALSALGGAVLLAWRQRAPKVLLARMILNLAADTAGGALLVLLIALALPVVVAVWLGRALIHAVH